MGSIMKEVMVFIEYLTCDKEGCDATMGNGVQSHIAQGASNEIGKPFVHTCPKCGSIQSFPYHYPRIVYKELPTVFQSEGAIDDVLDKIEKSLEEMGDEVRTRN